VHGLFTCSGVMKARPRVLATLLRAKRQIDAARTRLPVQRLAARERRFEADTSHASF